MKKLTALFGFGLFGILFSLGMTIYTGVQEYKEKNKPAPPLSIPPPAFSE